MSYFNEPLDRMSDKDQDCVRILNSLREEIEAIDYYHQRMAVATDPEAKAIFRHNRDEEIEHACMAIEWLRRNMEAWDEELKTYIFAEGSITEAEENATGVEAASGSGAGSLGIGNMK